jgi:hypothetical protein
MKDKELKLEDVDAPHTLGGASDVDKSSTLRNNNKQVLSTVYEGQVLNFSEGQF